MHIYGTTNNRLTKVNTTGWSYDANGNTANDGTFAYSYDNANRLASVTKTGLTASYLYNALGQRVEKTINGTSTVFIYDESGHLLGEYTPSGGLIAEHIWLNDRPIAVITPNGTFYVHTDQLDTPRYITNSSKQLVWEWSSDPFGTTAPNQNPSGLGTFTYNLRFPGQYYDAETGHDYNYFRDYNPAIGRYLESDPVGLLGGPNTYLYVDAKPATETDSKGQYGYAKPDKTLNTVICNGEGEMIPQVVQYGDLRDECLGSCLKAHEEQHIADLKRIGTFACRGKPYGEIVKFDTLQQDYASEVNAYNTEIHCLMEKLRAMICGDKCQAMTKARIAQIQAYMQRYEQ